VSTDRQIADLITDSVGYKTTVGPIDKSKVNAAKEGVQKPSPSSKLGKAAWELYLRDTPPPPPTNIPKPFDGKGMFLLEPTGGVEDVTKLKAAGFTYVMLNLAYVRGGSWDTVRVRCATAGIQVVPWRRVRGPEDSAQVENTANQWNSTATAHNLESEAITTYPPVNLGSYVAQNWPARSRAVITEPWAQNNAGWQHLSTWVGMPEAFVNADPRFTPLVITDHLKAEGIPHCVPAFGWGAWSDAPTYITPAQYLGMWAGPFAVYFGDSKEEQYGEWR